MPDEITQRFPNVALSKKSKTHKQEREATASFCLRSYFFEYRQSLREGVFLRKPYGGEEKYIDKNLSYEVEGFHSEGKSAGIRRWRVLKDFPDILRAGSGS